MGPHRMTPRGHYTFTARRLYYVTRRYYCTETAEQLELMFGTEAFLGDSCIVL